MLEINKNITLNGTVKIKGVQVASLTANLATDGNSNANTSKYINNQELYNSNKEEVRKDMAKFEEEVYKIEDEIKGA